MIDTQAIRSKILDLAMRGQLSEQLPEDGTADELYQRIVAHKNDLIASGVIKKDKQTKTPETENTLPVLPKTWKWVVFGTIITLQSGQDLKPEEYNSVHNGIPYLTGASNFDDKGHLTINRWTTQPKNIAFEGDILLSCKGTVGKLAILETNRVHIARQFMAIRTYDVNVRFAAFFLESVIDGIKKASKGLIPGIERNDVLYLNMPLPPLAEQDRIVKRIEQAFSVLDTIDTLQMQYTDNLTVLKSKLIDAAIQGKLTERLPEDGTATELLSRIEAEKNALIASGKIPKEKNLSDITVTEIPFDIPATWKWVRVQDVASYITDYVANGSFATLKAHTKTYKEPNYALFVRTMDLSANFKDQCSYIDKASYDFLQKSQLFGGELILPNIGASIGKAFIMPDMGMPMSLAPNAILLKFTEPIMNEYFSYVVKSTYGNKLLNKTQGGSATAKFSKTDLRALVVPLPPLNEIMRIVTTLNRTLELVDSQL